MFPVGRGHKLCALARQSVKSTSEQSSPKSTMSKATDNFNNAETVTLITVAGESVTSQNLPIILHPNTVGQYILQNIINRVEVENFSDQHLIIAGTSTSNTDLNSDQILDENSSTGGSDYNPVHDSHTDESEHSTESHESDPVADLDPNNHNINEGRKRRKVADPIQWKRNKNKKLRMEGKAYMGFVKGNTGKYEQSQYKDARHIKTTCGKEVCRKSKVRFCSEFSEDIRNRIFEHFWKITWEQRHGFVAAHVKHINKIRNTVNRDDSRRTQTLQYHLNNGQEQLKVCRQMFSDTLGIKYRMVHHWVKQSSFQMPQAPGRKRYKTDQKLLDNIDFLNNFLINLPKMPSHYCRKSSSKLYLEPTFHTIMDVYKFYLTKCEEEAVGSVSRTTFSAMIAKKNIFIFPTKKDQYNTCSSYKSGNIEENIWQDHINKKNTARSAKEKDKTEAELGNQITLEIDVQAVKLAPFTYANAFYYKTKLCCHNITVYNVATKHATCYWFSEDQNNQLVASTFTSCLVDYLTKFSLTDDKKPVTIYSDGCTAQNRNCVMSNALLNFSMTHNIKIVQKFLEVGHTQMEVDSVHACIERKLKNREIKLPSDYISITREARKNPAPYEAVNCEYSFFKNFSTPLRYSSIRPGRVAKDPVVMDIRVIDYDPLGVIRVKLDHSNVELSDLPIRSKKFPPIENYPNLFTQRCKIPKSKWQHLQELKSVIPSDCHHFYDNLPFI